MEIKNNKLRCRIMKYELLALFKYKKSESIHLNIRTV